MEERLTIRGTVASPEFSTEPWQVLRTCRNNFAATLNEPRRKLCLTTFFNVMKTSRFPLSSVKQKIKSTLNLITKNLIYYY